MNMVTMVRLLAATVLIVVVASACGSGDGPEGLSSGPMQDAGSVSTVETTGGVYQKVDAARLQAMLAAKEFVFVNVHIPYEGEIEGTDLFLPYDTIEQQLGELPADKDAKIVLYCQSGRMSTIAAEVLANSGYTNVSELDGGMIAWEAAGFPVAENGS